MLKTTTMYGVVSGGSQSMRGLLGMKSGRACGTYFGAVFFLRKFAKELARQWGDDARVVRVKVVHDA